MARKTAVEELREKAQMNPMIYKALGFANGNPCFILDGGTARIKGTGDELRDGRVAVTHFTHAFAHIDEATFKNLCYRSNDVFQPHFFAIDNHHYIVGEQAFWYEPGFEPSRGRLKYGKEYYGVLFVAAVLRYYQGNVPAKINAFLGYPPRDLELRIELMKSVAGTWHVTTNKGKITFKVDYVNAFDEVVGGMYNATLNSIGEKHKDSDLSGITLVFDLGGGTLDLAYMVDGQVDYNRPPDSMRIGINEAIRQFKSAFDMRYAARLTQFEDGIPMASVHAAFLDPQHQLELEAEDMIDCRKMYEEVVNKIMHEAINFVKQYNRVANVKRVMVTGGAAGLFYPEICAKVFPKFHEKNAIRVADFMGDMATPTPSMLSELVTANVRGARKMLQNIKVMQAEKAAAIAREGK